MILLAILSAACLGAFLGFALGRKIDRKIDLAISREYYKRHMPENAKQVDEWLRAIKG